MTTQQLQFVRPRPVGASLRACEIILSCFQHQPLLAADTRCRALAEILDDVLPRHHLTLRAFVFLPAGARMLVTHTADRRPRLAWAAYVIKRLFERQARGQIEAEHGALPPSLVERLGRGRYVFRFWEPGRPPIPLPDGSDLARVVRAIHARPVEVGCCIHPRAWRWSSWCRYHGQDPAVGVRLPRVAPLRFDSPPA